MHTSPQVEDKIIYLAIRNTSYAEIVRRLRKDDGVLIQRDTVSRIAKRFLNGEDFKYISGRPSVFILISIVTREQEISIYIQQQLLNN